MNMKAYTEKQIELEAYQYYLGQVNQKILREPNNSLHRRRKAAALKKIADIQGEMIDEEQYLNDIASYFGVTTHTIIKPANRKRTNAEARLVAVYILKKVTGKTDEALTEQFNYKNRSSISYAVKTIENLMSIDPFIENCINGIFSN